MSLESLVQALYKKNGFEILSKDESPSQLRLMGRVHAPFMGQWKVTMQRLLAMQENAPWKVDISKNYFLRANKVFYGWRLVFQAPDIVALYEELTKTILAAPASARNEVTEIPLIGTHRDPERVGVAGTVAVGPMAIRRR